MSSSIWKLPLLAATLALMPRPAVGVQPLPSSDGRPRFTLSRLHGLAQSSGYIFAGTVKAIEPVAPRRKGGVAVIQISFHVDKAIRGVRGGQTLTIREWAGLWQSGVRYRRGERVLLFLYPPSKLGLTSPVGGHRGRFQVDDRGQVVVGPGRGVGQSQGLSAESRLRDKTRLSFPDFVRALRSAEVE